MSTLLITSGLIEDYFATSVIRSTVNALCSGRNPDDEEQEAECRFKCGCLLVLPLEGALPGEDLVSNFSSRLTLV